MGHKAMPHNRLHTFGKRRDEGRIDLGNDHNNIAALGGVAARTADDAKNPSTARFGQINGAYKVDADVPLRITAADRIDQQRVVL